MKFSLAAISTAILAVSSVSGALIKRDEASDQEIISQYPNATDIGGLNGTWYLTGATQSVWDMYAKVQQAMNIQINCLQMNVTKSSNTSFDAIGSAFLNRNGSQVGVNATAAGAFFLQQPDSTVNVTDAEYLWKAYASQIFVNGAQWSNFTSDGQSSQNATESGSKPIPGSKPFEATIYSKLIDSNANPNDNNTSSNIDTVFLWGSKMQFFDPSEIKKRADEVYGIILSKTSSVGEDVFNKTLALLPPQIAQNNISVVLLNDTCHNSTQS